MYYILFCIYNIIIILCIIYHAQAVGNRSVILLGNPISIIPTSVFALVVDGGGIISKRMSL